MGNQTGGTRIQQLSTEGLYPGASHSRRPLRTDGIPGYPAFNSNGRQPKSVFQARPVSSIAEHDTTAGPDEQSEATPSNPVLFTANNLDLRIDGRANHAYGGRYVTNAWVDDGPVHHPQQQQQQQQKAINGSAVFIAPRISVTDSDRRGSRISTKSRPAPSPPASSIAYETDSAPSSVVSSFRQAGKTKRRAPSLPSIPPPPPPTIAPSISVTAPPAEAAAEAEETAERNMSATPSPVSEGLYSSISKPPNDLFEPDERALPPPPPIIWRISQGDGDYAEIKEMPPPPPPPMHADDNDQTSEAQADTPTSEVEATGSEAQADTPTSEVEATINNTSVRFEPESVEARSRTPSPSLATAASETSSHRSLQQSPPPASPTPPPSPSPEAAASPTPPLPPPPPPAAEEQEQVSDFNSKSQIQFQSCLNSSLSAEKQEELSDFESKSQIQFQSCINASLSAEKQEPLSDLQSKSQVQFNSSPPPAEYEHLSNFQSKSQVQFQSCLNASPPPEEQEQLSDPQSKSQVQFRSCLKSTISTSPPSLPPLQEQFSVTLPLSLKADHINYDSFRGDDELQSRDSTYFASPQSTSRSPSPASTVDSMQELQDCQQGYVYYYPSSPIDVNTIVVAPPQPPPSFRVDDSTHVRQSTISQPPPCLPPALFSTTSSDRQSLEISERSSHSPKSTILRASNEAEVISVQRFDLLQRASIYPMPPGVRKKHMSDVVERSSTSSSLPSLPPSHISVASSSEKSNLLEGSHISPSPSSPTSQLSVASSTQRTDLLERSHISPSPPPLQVSMASSIQKTDLLERSHVSHSPSSPPPSQLSVASSSKRFDLLERANISPAPSSPRASNISLVSSSKRFGLLERANISPSPSSLRASNISAASANISDMLERSVMSQRPSVAPSTRPDSHPAPNVVLIKKSDISPSPLALPTPSPPPPPPPPPLIPSTDTRSNIHSSNLPQPPPQSSQTTSTPSSPLPTISLERSSNSAFTPPDQVLPSPPITSLRAIYPKRSPRRTSHANSSMSASPIPPAVPPKNFEPIHPDTHTLNQGLQADIVEAARRRSERDTVVNPPSGVYTSAHQILFSELQSSYQEREERRTSGKLRFRDTHKKNSTSTPPADQVENMLERAREQERNSVDKSGDQEEGVKQFHDDWVPEDDLEDGLLEDEDECSGPSDQPLTSRSTDYYETIGMSDVTPRSTSSSSRRKGSLIRLKQSLQDVVESIGRSVNIGRRKISEILYKSEEWQILRAANYDMPPRKPVNIDHVELHHAYAYNSANRQMLVLPDYDRVAIATDGRRFLEADMLAMQKYGSIARPAAFSYGGSDTELSSLGVRPVIPKFGAYSLDRGTEVAKKKRLRKTSAKLKPRHKVLQKGLDSHQRTSQRTSERTSHKSSHRSSTKAVVAAAAAAAAVTVHRPMDDSGYRTTSSEAPRGTVASPMPGIPSMTTDAPLSRPNARQPISPASRLSMRSPIINLFPSTGIVATDGSPDPISPPMFADSNRGVVRLPKAYDDTRDVNNNSYGLSRRQRGMSLPTSLRRLYNRQDLVAL